MKFAIWRKSDKLSAFEKRFAVRIISNRTANRHRWTGREYQGDREKGV